MVKWMAETRRSKIDLIGLETAETQRVHAFVGLRFDDDGMRAVFQAAGVSYIQEVVVGDVKPASSSAELARRVAVEHVDVAYYSPTFRSRSHPSRAVVRFEFHDLRILFSDLVQMYR